MHTPHYKVVQQYSLRVHARPHCISKPWQQLPQRAAGFSAVWLDESEKTRLPCLGRLDFAGLAILAYTT